MKCKLFNFNGIIEVLQLNYDMYIRLSKCGYSVELLAFTVIENSKNVVLFVIQ